MQQQRQSAGVTGAYVIVTCLFFAWGFITSLNDPVITAVKGIFCLTDVRAQLSAFAFFIAYGVMSFPAALLLARMKSIPTILIAFALMAIGCLLMLAAANLVTYNLVLLGLFVLASGITILQVAANPLAAALGNPEYSHFRLTFSQTFNSLGTFIGPYFGAVLFLKGIETKQCEATTQAARADFARRDRPRLFLDLRTDHRACLALHRVPQDRHRSRAAAVTGNRAPRNRRGCERRLILALGVARRARDLPLCWRGGRHRHANGLLPPFRCDLGPERRAVRLPADRAHHGQ